MIKIKFLKDYRYFKKDQIIELDDSKTIVLVGDNGSGKSTILDLIYIASLRNYLKNKNEECAVYNLPKYVNKVMNYAKYNLFNKFDSICEIKFDNDYNFVYYNIDAFDITKDIDTRSSSCTAEDVAISVMLRDMSRGEKSLNQFFDSIETYNKLHKTDKNIRLIIDEPDSNVSIKHQVVLGKYLNTPNPIGILALHNNLCIKPFEKVYWVKPIFDELDKTCRIGTDMILTSGEEYVNYMISEGNRIIKEMNL